MAISPAKFQQLLRLAREKAVTTLEKAAVSNLSKLVDLTKPASIDISNLGFGNNIKHPEVPTILAEVASVAAESVKARLNALLAPKPALTTVPATVVPVPTALATVAPVTGEVEHKGLGVTRAITLNEKQQLFYDKVLTGESCVLIGAAGTGKTTSVRQVTRGMVDSGNYPNMTVSTKSVMEGSPGIVVLSFTRKAVANIRHAVIEELKKNTMTYHKILEFEPLFYEIEDPGRPGYTKNTMRFEPQRGWRNPLPVGIKAVFTEEASMVAVELHAMLMEAMPHKPQMIYLGDIQQLPPVFGLAILGFKMVELPLIELTEVYRQALNSPIISLAWKILGGNPQDFMPNTEKYKDDKGATRLRVPAYEKLSYENEGSSVRLQPWQKPLIWEHAVLVAANQLKAWIPSGYYNPRKDIILIPFNKSFGTLEMNALIGDYLAEKRNALVYHVVAGYSNHYLAVGDRVLYDKEDAFITAIKPNPAYMGRRPTPASQALGRDGQIKRQLTSSEQFYADQVSEALDITDMAAIERMLDLAAENADSEDRVNQASHIIHVKYAWNVDGEDIEEVNDHEPDEVLSTTAEVNALLGGYAITVHKAQGCEWEKVFFMMHSSNAVMNQRELLYTAVTRARKHLHIICEPNTFAKGIASQAIKGNTIAEKAMFFKGKVLADRFAARKSLDTEE
jgi:hypothetical protein